MATTARPTVGTERTPNLLVLLVRGTGVCDISDVATAVPFARELLTGDPDPLEAVSIVGRFIEACPHEGFKSAFAALRENGAEIIGSGEEFNHGDAVNIYAAPGVALGMALAYIAFMEGGV